MAGKLADLIDQRDGQAMVAAEQARVAAKEQTDRANAAIQAWSKATTALNAAVTSANKTFQEKGKARRQFRWQPRPQPGDYLVTAVLWHNDVTTLSETNIAVTRDGEVKVIHPQFVLDYDVHQVDESVWEDVLATIYATDPR